MYMYMWDLTLEAWEFMCVLELLVSLYMAHV